MAANYEELGGAEGAAELYAQRVLVLTKQMLRCAKRQEWESVMERDRLRVKQLEKLSGVSDASSRARRCLADALEIENNVRRLMETERNRLGEASRKERQQLNASKAYSQASDD